MWDEARGEDKSQFNKDPDNHGECPREINWQKEICGS